jgi:hypothetical protein
MLNQVLQEIANAKEPLSLTLLSGRLNIERSALDGMLAHWVRKGKLRDDDAEEASACNTGGVSSCGSTCTGADTCPFVAKMPKSYSMPNVQRKG